jgi:hypothetical protein
MQQEDDKYGTIVYDLFYREFIKDMVINYRHFVLVSNDYLKVKTMYTYLSV